MRILFRELELLPLTGYELRQVRRQFPLTQHLATSCGPTTMSGLAFLMAIHHMTDFVGMLDALVAMGADRRHVTILDKGYPYTDRYRVDGWLRTTLGMNVDLYPDRERIIGEHIARAQAAGLKTIIFDDGGYCWPIITERYPDKLGEFTGIVEQTMSDIWKLAGHPLPLPIFSVAESQLKATIESYGVSVTYGNTAVLRPLGLEEDLARTLLAAMTVGERHAACTHPASGARDKGWCPAVRRGRAPASG